MALEARWRGLHALFAKPLRFTQALALALATLVLGEAHAEKVLRYAFSVAETGFDPAQITDLYSRVVTANIFDAPLRYKWLSKGEFEPNTLAAMPDISSDYKTFTFHLKPGIYFANDAAFKGKKRELVAEDYVYSFKRICDPRWHSKSYGTLESLKIASLDALRNQALQTGRFDYDTPIEGIRALDRYTWQVKLGVPSPRFAENVYSDPSVFGAMAREVVERYGDAIMEHPVGTGPYMLAGWVRSSRMEFVRNPNYRVDIFHATPAKDDVEGRKIAAQFNGRPMPFIDRIEASVIEESQPRWLSFLNADQDLIRWVPTDLTALAMPNGKLAPNLAKKQIIAERVSEPLQYLLYFNMEDPVIGGYSAEKVALRRAIGLGLDVPRLISQVMNYSATPAQSVLLPGEYGFDPAFRSEVGEYDSARANAILDVYGYLPRHGGRWRDLPDGQPLTLPIMATPDQLTRNIDEVIKKSMDALGIRTVFQTAAWPDQLKKMEAGTYTIWYLGSSAQTLDPSGTLEGDYGPAKGGANLSRFDLPAYNALYLKSEALPNGAERLAVIAQMVALLNAYLPEKYALNAIRIYLHYPWVLGYRYDPLIADWWRYVDIDAQMQSAYRHASNSTTAANP